ARGDARDRAAAGFAARRAGAVLGSVARRRDAGAGCRERDARRSAEDIRAALLVRAARHLAAGNAEIRWRAVDRAVLAAGAAAAEAVDTQLAVGARMLVVALEPRAAVIGCLVATDHQHDEHEGAHAPR